MPEAGVRRMLSAALCLLLCLAAAAAAAEIAVTMEADEWTWEAGGVSSFHGTIDTGGELIPGASMTLTVQTRLEDSGRAVFLRLCGKKMKIRNRSETAVADLSANPEENSFEAEWYLPESTEEGIAAAKVTLTVTDAEGKPLAEGTMQVGSEAEEEAKIGVSPVKRADQLMIFLGIGCVLFWGLAIGRALMIRKAAKKG